MPLFMCLQFAHSALLKELDSLELLIQAVLLKP